MALDLNRGETSGSTGSDLDRYGVWVKKPPRTVEDTAAPTEEELQEPSPIDDLESAAREETSGIDTFMDKSGSDAAVPDGTEDGLPPDTFIDADFLDDFTNDISALEEIQEESVQPASQEDEVTVGDLLGESDEVPLEDFMAAGIQEESDILDESPIDMDLTFDDEFTLEAEAESPDAVSRQDEPEQAGGEKTAEIQGACLDSLQVSDYTGTSLESDDDFDAEKITSEAEYIGGNACGDEPTADEAVQGHSESDDTQTEKSQDDMIERPEEAMEFNQDGIEQPAGSRTEELISNIASEIALLRDEIANLKADFEAFKGGKSSAADPEIQQESSGGGFFADTEDDDTIALSGDELSNIFNTADFTEESVEAEDQRPDEEPDNGLPAMDFESETLEEPVIEDSSLGEESDDGLPEEIDVPTGAAEQQESIFEEVELEEDTEELFDDMFDGFDFEDEPLVEEATQVQEASSIDETMEAASAIADGEAEPVADEPETVEAFEEEVTDEPTEAVFESSQWEEPAGLEGSQEETADTAAFDDDPLVIEEDVDTVSDAEEELLEELAAEDVAIADDGTEAEGFQAEETDFVEPVIEDLPAVEPEPVAEVEAIDETDLSDETEAADRPVAISGDGAQAAGEIPDALKNDIKAVLAYMDKLLDSLPEEKIAEFARSEHFELYKRLFTELGLS